MASEKDLAERTLKDHVNKLKKEKFTIIVNERYENVREVEKPREDVEKGYSQIMEIEILTKDVETLLFDVIFFAPSSVEILEPKEIKLGLNSLQSIMNSVADVLHTLASVGGGIVISTKK